MLSRRDFLRNAALVAAGTVAANQLDLLDKIGWRRRFFLGWSTQRDVEFRSNYLDADCYVQIIDQFGAPIGEKFALIKNAAGQYAPECRIVVPSGFPARLRVTSVRA